MESSEKVEIDWLKQWNLYAPRSIAFKDADSGVEYSYSTLFSLSCKLASHLRSEYGIGIGARVAVFAANEIEYVPLFFAVQRLGAILVPINFRLTGREISHILEDCGAALLVYQEQFQHIIQDADQNVVPQKRWSFDGSSRSLRTFLQGQGQSQGHEQGVASPSHASRSTTQNPLAMQGDFDSPCMILYTSGTTGAPKGALITNKMLHWNSLNTTLRLNLNQNDVALSFLPFFHTGGWNVLVTPFLHRGARTILMKKFDPKQVLELCEKEGVTILFGVPTTMDMMCHSVLFEKVDLSSVRYAIVGGEPMPIELIRSWAKKGVPIRQGYGLTEFGPNVFSLNEEDAIRKIGSIGFPNFYIEAKVVNDQCAEVPAGEIGELILRGPVCTPGYWKNPEATAQTIRDGWLYTGDLVKYDEDGYYYVAGRKKDMFISGGENVYPVEIERYLSSHPAIREVAVVGVPDERWGEVGKAYVALNDGARLTAEELLGFCGGKLAKYKTPKHVAFLPELPKGDSGKILKRKLLE